MSNNIKTQFLKVKNTKNKKKKGNILTRKNKKNKNIHNNLKKKIKIYKKQNVVNKEKQKNKKNKDKKKNKKNNKNKKNKKININNNNINNTNNENKINKKFKLNNESSNKLKQSGGYASADQCAGDINQKLMGNPPVKFEFKRSEDTAVRQLEKQTSGNLLDSPGPPPSIPSDCVIL